MSVTIPDSIRTRIQKLLALANDGRGNEHEAAAASAKVQSLLSEYNLEMSQVQETAEEEIAPDALRDRSEYAAETTQTWQVDLMARIAMNNFCLHWTNGRFEGDRLIARRHSLIGRRVNIATTLQVYEYLSATMERLNPFTDKRRTKSRRSWFEGCASRLESRLYQQRAESMQASRDARNEGPRGNGLDIVLADVYSSEDDLNRDLRWGYVPGTTARTRRENEAKWAAERAAREAQRAMEPEQPAETDAQRRRREAKDEADMARNRKRWARDDAKAAARIDRDAYAMGQNTGAQIGLNTQVGHGSHNLTIS